MTEQSQRKNAFIWLFVAFFGFLICALPQVFNIGIQDGAPALIALGGLMPSGRIAARGTSHIFWITTAMNSLGMGVEQRHKQLPGEKGGYVKKKAHGR